jgi:hypothetical protein
MTSRCISGKSRDLQRYGSVDVGMAQIASRDHFAGYVGRNRALGMVMAFIFCTALTLWNMPP